MFCRQMIYYHADTNDASKDNKGGFFFEIGAVLANCKVLIE